MDASTPKRARATGGRKSVHWWSPEIGELRNRNNHLRRTYQRRRRRGGECQVELEAAKVAKLRLVTAIRRSKQAAWAELCAMVDADSWGKPYRLVMARLGPRRPIPGLNTSDRVEAIVDDLFPTHQVGYAGSGPMTSR